MMLVSTISYIDRNTLALLIPTIRAEASMTQQQYGVVVSAFSVAYMIGNPAWGWTIDRIGLRAGMTAAVFLWTLASAGHAWAAGFLSFAVLRALLGFGEGATFPGSLRTVIQTLPVASRARGIALAYSGGSLGATITPILMTPVAAAFGWRGAFLFTGAIGAAWLVGWLVLSRRDDIQAHIAPEAPVAERLSFLDLRLWGFLAAYAFGAVPLSFVMYFTALYLSGRFGLTQTEIGKLLWIPAVGWETGYFFWGWMCDRLGFDNIGRILLTAAVFSLPLTIAPAITSVPLLMLELFVASFMISGFIIPSINYATRVFPASNTALLGGLGAGSYGVVTAFTAPFFGRVFDAQRYELAFWVAGALPAVGFVVWFFIRRATHPSPKTT